MARFRPKGLGLERVLGVGALFSTAYGNVGSSIYYALGLVAAFALGMTPIVYLIAGGLFVMTAMTYAEAATNFPEAGGSSSFARRAFNELVSFFAAWGQMLNYIITVAISAFFVPHYLAVFWEPLGESPGDIIGGIVIVVLLSAINIVGVTESARLNFLLAVIDFATQALLLLLGVFLVLNFETLIDNVHLWTAPTVSDFVLSITIAMISYTGIETISNLAEEAREPRRRDPARDGVRRARRDGHLQRPARGRAVGAARHRRRATRPRRSSPTTYAGRPDPRNRARTWTWASSRRPRSTTSASWPPRSC